MTNISTPRGREQSNAPDFVRILKTDQLVPRERGLINASLIAAEAAPDGHVQVDVWPVFRLGGRHLRGAFRCPQCEQVHVVGLSDPFIRCPACRGRVAPGARRIGDVRTVWRMPEDTPEPVAHDVDHPEIGWCPAMLAEELRGIAKTLRRRKDGRPTSRERQRLFEALRGLLRCRAFEVALAERLDGGESRRDIAVSRRELCHEIYRRHAGPGRTSFARTVDVGGRALEHLFYRGSLW